MISISEIFKQTLALLRTHKFLWGLGLFLFWDLAANSVSYTIDSHPELVKPNPNVNTWAVVLAFIVMILFIQLFFRGRAAIMLGTKNILEKKPTDFRTSFGQSRKYYLRIFGVWLGSIFVLILAGLVLAAPITYLFSINYPQRAGMLALFALIIFVPLSLIANFVNNLAPLVVVFYDFNVKKAVTYSLDLIREYWTILLLFAVSLGLVTFVASFLVVLAGSSGVVIFAKIFYNTAGIHITAASGILGICAFAAFLIFAGAIASFQQIAWTLLFTKISKPQKTEETEPLPVPEVIS